MPASKDKIIYFCEIIIDLSYRLNIIYHFKLSIYLILYLNIGT